MFHGVATGLTSTYARAREAADAKFVRDVRAARRESDESDCETRHTDGKPDVTIQLSCAAERVRPWHAIADECADIGIRDRAPVEHRLRDRIELLDRATGRLRR